MNEQTLKATAAAMTADARGLLAMDESNPTADKRFAALGIAQTPEMRRAYRDMIVTAPGLSEAISGAILYDETIRTRTFADVPFAEALAKAGIIPASRWTRARSRSRCTRASWSPRGWTACAIAWRSIRRWARASPSGAR